MAAEVKLTLSSSDYIVLQSLLSYLAGKLSKEQFVAVLTGRGYKVTDFDAQVQYIAEQLCISIR